MSKYLVETYYTCTFKVNHRLDNISEADLKSLEKRDDGEFEILDVKLDNRKTKSLDPNNNKVINKNEINLTTSSKETNQKNLQSIIKKTGNNSEKNGKRFSMPDRRKGYIQKLQLVITKFICILVNMKMEKLGKFLLIQVKKVN